MDSSNPRKNLRRNNLDGVDDASVRGVAANSVAEIVDSRAFVVVTGICIPLATDFLFDWFVSVCLKEGSLPGGF